MARITADDTLMPDGVGDMGQTPFEAEPGALPPGISDPLSLPANWTPHRPAARDKSEGGKAFVLDAEYEPAGDQPGAIAELSLKPFRDPP